MATCCKRTLFLEGVLPPISCTFDASNEAEGLYGSLCT
jgi:hypothetical protein